MNNAETIIQRIQAEQTEILRLYQHVPATSLQEAVLSNGWTAKDTLAHLAAWVWRCTALLTEARQSDGPLKAQPDVEGLNQEFYRERRNWEWKDVEIDFKRAHKALFNAIRQLPPERLHNPLIQQTIAQNTWEHYAKHLPNLKQWALTHGGVVAKPQ